MGSKLLAGVTVALVLATSGWLYARTVSQRDDMARMTARIESLEARIEEGTASPEVPSAGTVAPPPAPARPDTAARLAKLQVDDAMRARVVAAVARDGTAPSEPNRVVRDALLDVLSTDDPELRDGFRNLVREEQAALRDEWRERRQTRWEEQTSERLSAFRNEHGLSQAQEDALFALLTAARDRIGEMFREAREAESPLSRREMRERIDTIRNDADREARELLDDDQYEAYEALRDDEGFLGPGGRGPRGPAQ